MTYKKRSLINPLFQNCGSTEDETNLWTENELELHIQTLKYNPLNSRVFIDQIIFNEDFSSHIITDKENKQNLR